MKEAYNGLKIYFQAVKKSIKIIIWLVGIFSTATLKIIKFIINAIREGIHTKLGYKMFIYCLAWALASNLVIIMDGTWASSLDNTLSADILSEKHLPEIEEIDFDKLSITQQIKIIAQREKWEDADLLLDLSWCESRWDRYAIGDQGHSRGLFQIHNGYHNVSNAEAFDVNFATVWTINKLKQGGHNLWSCYKIIR